MIPTLGYSLFVSAVVGLQILSGYQLVKIMDAPNFVFSAKLSLLTLALCNIEDFSQTMNHIQYIMNSSVVVDLSRVAMYSLCCLLWPISFCLLFLI